MKAWTVLALSLMGLVAPVVRAQSSHGDGSQTGDGSTAFTALSQTVEADMFIGAAQSTVPIQVPPGRALTPRLALRYSSHAGPSPYGYGWDLPLPRIQRATKRGARTCGAERLEFVLTLPTGTIACTLLPGGVCRPRVEETFAKIRATAVWDGTATRLTWHAWDKSGVRYTFGGVSASTDDGATFTAAARTGDDAERGGLPATCGYGASWQLTAIEDPNGNRVEVRWLLEQNVLYPHAIRYGGNGGLAHMFEVGFSWEGRLDQLTSGPEGVAARLTKRLARIDVRREGAQVRAYTFGYASGRTGRQTFLEAVRLRGRDNSELARGDGAPAAATFVYHAKVPGFAAVAQTPPRPALGGSQPNVLRWTQINDTLRTTIRDVFDVNGDGFADLVEAGTCPWTVYLGSPAGFATSPIAWSVPPAIGQCSIRRTVDNGPTYTIWTTMDLTGDGIPDLVDARNRPWTVYPGTANAVGGGWGFGAPMTWAGTPSTGYPQLTLSHTIGNQGANNNWEGTAVRQDLVDVNGDGLSDLVIGAGGDDGGGQGAPLDPALWTVYPNTGSGFGTGYTFQAPFKNVSFTSGNGASHNGLVYGTFDVNGDGLPDGVLSQRLRGAQYTGSWRVCLNSGRAMDVCSTWSLPAAWQVGNVAVSTGMFRWIRAADNGQPGDVLRDLIDINGDGLPDLVDATGWSTTGLWSVFLNRGDGFEAAPLSWPAPFPFLRDVANGGRHTFVDTFDLDGDGSVDMLDFSTSPCALYHAAGGAWAAAGANAVARENGIRADLLVASENGIGAATFLRYRPSTEWDNTGGDGVSDLPFALWTVTEIRHDDGLCAGSTCTNPESAHQIGSRYTYRHGRYDPVGRAFRGFAWVTREELAPALTPHAGVFTVHHQTAALAGRLQARVTYEASSGGSWVLTPISGINQTWECANPTSGAPITCPPQPAGDVWVRLKSVVESAYTSFSFANPRQTKTENATWHQCGSTFYGNVQDVTRGSLTGSPVVRTHTEYACRDQTASGGAYIVDRPVRVLVSSSDDATRLEEKWFFYDGLGYAQLEKGNVTRTESWLSQSAVDGGAACTRTPAQGSGGCVRTLTAYDGFGNLIAVTDALGRVTTTTYDSATHIYPVQIDQPAVTGNGYRIAREYDPGCATLLWESIPFKPPASPGMNRTEHTYDAFCRLLRTWRPGESTSGTPYREHAYHLGAPARPGVPARLTVIAITTREPNHSGGARLSTMLADGLGRVIQQKSESEVDGAPALVASATRYDALGRVSWQSLPFVWSCGASGCFLRYTEAPSGTSAAGILRDAIGRPIRHTNPDGKYRTIEHQTAWEVTVLDECAQAGESCAGGRTTTKRDALGRIAEQSHFSQSGALLARTRFDYDELGRLTGRVQGNAAGWNASTAMAMTYDSLGRMISRRDPDAGPGLWEYGYDRTGNLRHHNDPQTGQHVERCYDALGRMTKKFVLAGDAFTNANCNGAATVSYSYNEATTVGLGQLSAIADQSGTWNALQFDVLGRVLRERRMIEVDGDQTTAEMRYQYDATGDHLWKLTYPDGEVLTHTYDGVGRINSLSGREPYLVNLTYDALGRPRRITHGNGVEDERTYARPGQRLSEITTTRGVQSPTVLLRYGYSYEAAGRLRELNDLSPSKGPNGVLDNGAVYTYDGMGRLVAASGPQLGNRSYLPSVLGNLDAKEGVTFSYGTTATPHQATAYGSHVLEHDANGNRTFTGMSSRSFTYDREDRLLTIDGGQVAFGYDHSGQRAMMRRPDNTVIRYFSPLFEASSAGTITKYYVADGMLIAQRDESNTQFASAAGAVPISVAGRSLLEPTALVLVLRRDVQLGLAAVMLAVGVAVVGFPGRRRHLAMGVAVRRHHALGLALAVGAATMPWPLVLAPAPAEGQCNPAPRAIHYHLDHLGSTQLLTNPNGATVHHVRYTPYGEPRRFTAAGAPKSADPRYRREFTGYETELYSNLQYAGARFYDPSLGMFLTHDPAGQFASPYTYGNWDPVNGTDPSGAIFGLGALLSGVIIGAIVGSAVGATAAGIHAAVNGASVGGIFKAAAIGQGIGAATGAISAGVLQPALSTILGPIVSSITSSATAADTTASALLTAGSLAQAAYGIAEGDYVNGSIGLAMGVVAVLGLATQGANGAGGISQENQLKFNAREFGQRYGVATRPSGGVGGFLRTAGRVGVDVIGKLWALPNTIIGGVIGLGGVPFGARIEFGNNAIQFLDFPLGEAGEGLTLGNVQIFPRGSDPATSFGFYYGSPVPINLGLHEQAHTFQYQVFGPTFLPAYFLSGGISASNPFELAANRYALGGSFFP